MPFFRNEHTPSLKQQITFCGEQNKQNLCEALNRHAITWTTEYALKNNF